MELQIASKRFMAEFYRVTQAEHGLITRLIRVRLQNFPEAADINYITFTCIADIESILTQQITTTPKGKFNTKERLRKLTEFQKDHHFVKRYTLEAVKSFCRKKQHRWTHGKNKAVTEKGETHVERKQGIAARIHGTGSKHEVDSWITSIVSSPLTSSSLEAGSLEALDALFKRIGVNEEKASCFWDRFNGMTFVEMAKNSPNKEATPDQYRKRFKRLIANLEKHSSEFRDIFIGGYY